MLIPRTLQEFIIMTTPHQRARAAKLSRDHALKHSTITPLIVSGANRLKQDLGLETCQTYYVVSLEAFFSYATTVTHDIEGHTMLNQLMSNKRIYWNSYK